MDSAALQLLGPTRKALILEIKDRGLASAEELAAACFLSPAAARMHLSSMEGLGILEHTNVREGPGRPRNLYRLTPEGERLFPDVTGRLAVEVLGALGESPDCLDAIWAILEDRQTSALRQEARGETLAERVRSLTESRPLSPFFPDAKEHGPGSWTIRMRHCPVLQVARAHPVLCEIERRAIAAALGEAARVTNPENRPGGAATCYFPVEGS